MIVASRSQLDVSARGFFHHFFQVATTTTSPPSEWASKYRLTWSWRWRLSLKVFCRPIALVYYCIIIAQRDWPSHSAVASWVHLWNFNTRCEEATSSTSSRSSWVRSSSNLKPLQPALNDNKSFCASLGKSWCSRACSASKPLDPDSRVSGLRNCVWDDARGLSGGTGKASAVQSPVKCHNLYIKFNFKCL